MDQNSFDTPEKVRAQGVAFLRASEMVANQWNLLPRTKAWFFMAPELKRIWNNLRALGNDEIERSEQMPAQPKEDRS